MTNLENKKSFIVKFIYLLIWGVLLYAALKYLLPLLTPFILAFGIAFMLKPLINKLAKKTKLNRKLIAVLALIFLYLVIGGILTLLGAKLIIFLSNWFSSLPTYYSNSIEPFLNKFSLSFDGFFRRADPAMLAFFEQMSETIQNSISNIIQSISSGSLNLLKGMAGKVPLIIVNFVLTIITSFFFVVDYYKITNFIVRQLPKTAARKLFVVKNFAVNVLLKFGKAYLILISITFCEVFIGLLILKSPNAFLVALIIALVDILPVFGTGTIILPWSIYSLVQGNYYLGFGLIVLYVVITIVRQTIEPRIVGKQIGLYPLLTLLAMFVGARLFGFFGIFGLPIALTVIIHLNRTGEISLFKE